MKVLCILTCYNRKDITEKCIKSLADNNNFLSFHFIIVDDNSNDGTKDMLEKLKEKYSIHVIYGNGHLYYSGGMRVGMQYALDSLDSFDYLLMVNDDVSFFPNAIEEMVKQSRQQNGAVIVGAMRDSNGCLSYSAIKYISDYDCRRMDINEWQQKADTCNANCVLIPYDAFVDVGPIDCHYIHFLGDFDYGLDLKRHGYDIHVSSCYCGVCNRNSNDGTWLDRKLSIKKRLELKESPKGSPAKQCFYFCYKNFGIINAVISTLRPFLKILLKR